MIPTKQKFLYAPILKGKAGERSALGSLSSVLAPYVAPLLVVPPSGDYDPESGKVLGPAEHLKTFGSSVGKNRGKRPVFIDASVLGDQGTFNISAHPLTEILERVRLGGGLPLPATSLGRSDAYQRAVKRAAAAGLKFVALRLSAQDLEEPTLKDQLSRLLTTLDLEPKNALVILDFGSRGFRAGDGFSDVFIERLNDFPFLHLWNEIAFSATSFPENVGPKSDEVRVIERGEWRVYNELVERRPELNRVPIFSDYGIEHPKYQPPKRVSPSAQLRYTTPPAFLISKGENVRTAGYREICKVAERLAAHSDFSGADYSLGDARIDALAKHSPKTGNASTWRWATMDHHLTLVTRLLMELFGIRVSATSDQPSGTYQGSLFPQDA